MYISWIRSLVNSPLSLERNFHMKSSHMQSNALHCNVECNHSFIEKLFHVDFCSRAFIRQTQFLCSHGEVLSFVFIVRDFLLPLHVNMLCLCILKATLFSKDPWMFNALSRETEVERNTRQKSIEFSTFRNEVFTFFAELFCNRKSVNKILKALVLPLFFCL